MCSAASALPRGLGDGVLVTLELPPGMTRERGYAEIGSIGSPDALDTPLVRFCALLAEYGVTERTVIALPGDRAQAARLLEVREAVPAAVNRRVGLAKRNVDARIEKTAADMIVPFEQFETLLERVRAGACRSRARCGDLGSHFGRQRASERHSANVCGCRIGTRGDPRIWAGGHSARRRAARRARRRPQSHQTTSCSGSSTATPASTHMRHVKAALDPDWKLSPGVIFAKVSDTHLTP